MASLDMQSHLQNKSGTNNQYIAALSTAWTDTNQPCLQPLLVYLGQMELEIHMSRVAQNTLYLISGKPAQLQVTGYLAPIKRNQIKDSIIRHNC
jgi:hypothetical protein